MVVTNLQLTPEQREAVLANPQEPIYIADQETRRVFMLVEKGRFPELEDEYILNGLELARQQILRGETSTSTIEDVIQKAQQPRKS